MARGIILISVRDNRVRVFFGWGGILKVFLMTEGAASFVSVNAAVSDWLQRLLMSNIQPLHWIYCCHLTAESLSFISWSTGIMSLDWSCHGWLNSETLRSVSMVTWYSAARAWRPWSRSPSTHRLPTWRCPDGTQRRQAPYPLTFAPRSPAACCSSATAACRGRSLTRSRGPTFSPSSCLTDSSTWSWTWAPAASRWKPVTRGWTTASGATWTSRGTGAMVKLRPSFFFELFSRLKGFITMWCKHQLGIRIQTGFKYKYILAAVHDIKYPATQMTPIGRLKDCNYRATISGSGIFSITKMNANVLYQHRSRPVWFRSDSTQGFFVPPVVNHTVLEMSVCPSVLSIFFVMKRKFCL